MQDTTFLELLANAPITDLERQDYEKGQYPSRKVRVEDDGDAIVKDDVPPRKFMGNGTPSSAIAEVAAYEIAKQLGYDDLVPPTTMRSDGSSAQSWIGDSIIAGRYDLTADIVDSESIKQMLVLDALINNRDRHEANFIIGVVDGKPKAIAIDHGLSFSNNSGDVRHEVNTLFAFERIMLADLDFPVPQLTEQDLAPLHNLDWGKIEQRLGPEATGWMRKRAEYMLTPEFLERQ